MKTAEIIKMLTKIANRGLNQEPVTWWINKTQLVFVCQFTIEERREIGKFVLNNPKLQKLGKHSLGDFLGEKGRTTISLGGRLNYAANSKNISPDYLSMLIGELQEHEVELNELAELYNMIR